MENSSVALDGGDFCWQRRQRCISPCVSLARLAVHVIEWDGVLPGLPWPLLIIDAVGHLGHDGQAQFEEHIVESRAVLFPHQAVDDRVEAAAGEGQAVGQREEVRLSDVVRAAVIDDVKLDQDAPECEDVVREPAGAERKDHHGYGLWDIGPSPRVSAPQLVLTEEVEKEQVGRGDDGVGQQKPQHHSQELVYPKPGCAIREPEQARCIVVSAHTHQVSENGPGCRCYQRRRPDRGCDHRRCPGATAEGLTAWESGGYVAVPGHAHSREEKAAGVDVEPGEQRHGLARGQAERPAVVQNKLYGPERQSEGEEQLGQSQVEHKDIDGARGDGVSRIEQEHH